MRSADLSMHSFYTFSSYFKQARIASVIKTNPASFIHFEQTVLVMFAFAFSCEYFNTVVQSVSDDIYSSPNAVSAQLPKGWFQIQIFRFFFWISPVTLCCRHTEASRGNIERSSTCDSPRAFLVKFVFAHCHCKS